MPSCPILLQLWSVWLHQTNVVEKYQVLCILCAIHSLQFHGVHAPAETLTGTTRYNSLQLLEVSHKCRERLVRLLTDTLKEPVPLLILILTALVAQNEIDLAKGRRRRPYNFGVFAWPFVVQYTFERPQLKSSLGEISTTFCSLLV